MFPVEIFQMSLAKLTSILQEHDIRYHLTGGLTGTAYGEPRMTQDIDVVIDPMATQEHVDAFIGSLSSSDFMFSEENARHAIATGDLFQLLDQQECLKLDIYPREMIPGELERSEMLEIFAGQLLPVVSRVDAAASKLIWISKGSHKSRRDLRSILRNCTPEQRASVRQQSVAFQLLTLLEEVIEEPDEIQ